MALSRRNSSSRLVLGGIILLLVILLFAVPGQLIELLWMQALGYASVFWTLLGLQSGLFLFGLLVVTAYFGANFYALMRQPSVRYLLQEGGTQWQPGSDRPPQLTDLIRSERSFKAVATALTGMFALLFAGSFSAGWDDLLHYWYAQPYGQTDPLFGKDISVYLLQLPFVEAVQGNLVGLFFLGLLVMGTLYVLLGQIQVRREGLRIAPSVVRHLAVNLLLLLAVWVWGYYLDRYALLYTPGGVVFGASYVDANIRIPLLWLKIIATLLLIGLVLLNLFQKRLRLLIAGAGLYVFVLAASLFVPGLVQQFQVEPNELARERPYLQHNIDLTREAYGLTDVRTVPYAATGQISLEDVQNNEETLNNVRLWDPRLLIQTFRQLQEIRPYYQFYDVDVDRYMIDGEYRQVMASARELSQRLPGRVETWFNRHLQYTHGYGLTMNLVAQEGEEGTPSLLIRDIPPESVSDDLEVTRPAIYYGERTSTYRIVNSQAEELDYPRGDDNVYTHYDGRGGVLLGSLWRDLLFAWHTSDFNIVLSDYITTGTRIQFWNRLQERIRRVAPFLALDEDPYLVLSEGRLVWVQDAYTTGHTFPYSEPAGTGRQRFNYIRNSVKVVVDAYHGDVTFYVVDDEDPLLDTYQAAFPDLFQPLSEMSEDLQRHMRYPQDLFDVQVDKYNRYHMANPQVFYNNEDLWERPDEHYAGQSVQMEPYYILTRLPGQEQLQYLLMTPVTPSNRDNMIAWIAGNSDFPNYGELIVYELPKERLIYGPTQVEARIDQNTELSQQLALWDQHGSSVVRGNLMVVPVEESFLYVEPVFLIAEGRDIPQLQRVIVSHGERIAMQPTMEQSLQVLFGEEYGTDQPRPVIAGVGGAEELQEARQLYQQAQQALQAGNFAAFGSAFEDLREVLDRADTLAVPQGLPPADGQPQDGNQEEQVPTDPVSQPIEEE